MEIVWDPVKAKANFEKHGIRFGDAEMVLSDSLAVTLEDPRAEDEQRHISIGSDALARILVVIYTYRGEEIRLISARRASRKERQAYERGI